MATLVALNRMGRQLASLSRRWRLGSCQRFGFSSDTTLPDHTLVGLPALSPTMETGSIVQWHLSVGDMFNAGDALCNIETDKAALDLEAQDEGYLAKILAPLQTELKLGTPICVTVTEADDVAAFADYTVPEMETAPTEAAAPDTEETTAPTETATPSASTSEPSLLFPSARHLAESQGKDATVLKGSGKGGRVTKHDVQQNLASLPDLAPLAQTKPMAAAAPAAPSSSATATTVVDPLGPFQDVPNSKMRKIIAKRLTESKTTVPHSYTSIDIEMDAVLQLRKQLPVKISVNDFVLKSAALALRDVPTVNASYSTTSGGTVQGNDTIDISVAVATPTGLITPIVQKTDTLGLFAISTTVKDLAERARDGKLAPHEYQGGSFSVSNLGMFGISEFTAVINPPQSSILAIGGGRPVLVDMDTTRTVLTARLSSDRRVVDENTASLFMQAFREYLQEPQHLLL